MPAYGIIDSTVLAPVAIIINYLGSNGATVFTTLVLMTGMAAPIPYGFSALAQIRWRLADRRSLDPPRFVRDMVVAVASLVFSVLFIWYSRNAFAVAGTALLIPSQVLGPGRFDAGHPAPRPGVGLRDHAALRHPVGAVPRAGRRPAGARGAVQDRPASPAEALSPRPHRCRSGARAPSQEWGE